MTILFFNFDGNHKMSGVRQNFYTGSAGGCGMLIQECHGDE